MSHLIDNIADYLASNGVGTVATNIFVGTLPDSPDTCIAVLDTGGSQPDQYIPTKEPTFQILIRSTDYDLGKTKLDLIRSLLHQKSNLQFVTGGQYCYFVLALSEGGHIGRDLNGFDMFSINFQTRTR
ncbi:minor capsid protein [Patescibacteria group bacterium]|nr:minor capsid protein [Patescibacteria group bacterium]